MITTVTANPALDVTYEVSALSLDAAHRVRAVHRQAGGKGVNVARALTLMGVSALAIGLVGGSNGQLIREELERSGIDHQLIETSGTSRQTVTAFTASGSSIELDEPGVEVDSDDWDALLAAVSSRLSSGGVVAVSGSLPPGLPDTAYRDLVDLVHATGNRVVLDTSGPALRSALSGGVDVVKPNAAELAALAGIEARSPAEVVTACRRVRDLGAAAVVASRGSRGAIAVTEDGAWQLTHPARAGNAVGAGDVLVAGLSAGLEVGWSFIDAVRNGVEWSFASLAYPFGGWLDPDAVAAGRHLVVTEPIGKPADASHVSQSQLMLKKEHS